MTIKKISDRNHQTTSGQAVLRLLQFAEQLSPEPEKVIEILTN